MFMEDLLSLLRRCLGFDLNDKDSQAWPLAFLHQADTVPF